MPFQCNKCGTWWSDEHYSDNHYHPEIKDGAPCPAGTPLKQCKGTIVKLPSLLGVSLTWDEVCDISKDGP